jgi:small subunit ribosomal protein S17
VNEVANAPRSVVGKVVSAGMDKTISVLVERQVEHPLYRKFVRKSSKIFAHDEENSCSDGDIVSIEECRPLSKKKSWRLQKIIEKVTVI